MRQGYGTAILLLSFYVLSGSPHCTRYGVCNNYQHVPAPPGHTPNCAKPGSTFCENVDHYPRELIRHLLENWGYDHGTLLGEESRADFDERKSLFLRAPYFEYGPLVQRAVSYGPINTSGQYLEQPPQYNSEARLHFNAEGVAYRGRMQHSHPQSPRRWKRYKRSEERRRRRQATSVAAATLCPTRAGYIMPRAALNVRGNWMYTVNLNEISSRYTQLVRSETCLSNRCNGLCTVPNGYTSRCQQQYVQKRLVALDGSGDRLYSDFFWFPHCCVCQITSN